MDRTYQGLIAGVIGAIPMNIINFIFYGFKLTQVRFIDWAGIIVTGNLPNDWNSMLYSLIYQLFWSGVIGIGLAFLVPVISSKGYLLKSVLYSFFVSFLLRGVVVLFRIPHLDKIPTLTSELNFITIIVWALTSGYVLSWLDQQEGSPSS